MTADLCYFLLRDRNSGLSRYPLLDLQYRIMVSKQLPYPSD